MEVTDKKGINSAQLKRAKNLAVTFLNLPMELSEIGNFMVYHPFFEMAFLNDENGLFHALEEPERFMSYKKAFEKNIIEPCDSLNHLLALVRKSYRLTFLKYLLEHGIVTMRECGNLLAEQWTRIENINHDVNVSKKQVLKWIKNADKTCIMDEQDMETYRSLDSEVTIYRGCQKGGKEGISWTLDKTKADWFARRWLREDEHGYVYTAKINKKDIIAYVDARHEKEVIIDFRKIYDVKREVTIK